MYSQQHRGVRSVARTLWGTKCLRVRHDVVGNTPLRDKYGCSTARRTRRCQIRQCTPNEIVLFGVARADPYGARNAGACDTNYAL